MSASTPKTWRVRGISLRCTKDCLLDMAQAGEQAAGGDTRAISVDSLAIEADGGFQTATISIIEGSSSAMPTMRACKAHSATYGEGSRSIPVVDEHFLGLTTLHAPPPEDHMVDILAISGLGGHAFGSFKERGGQHMWLRDALPYDLIEPRPSTKHNETTGSCPIARVMIYGYSSPVANSNSVQNVDDLARTLRQQLLATIGTGSNTDGNRPRPLVILSHSLGGLVLKQVIITLAASKEASANRLCSVIGGLVFFGVPHSGMAIASLETMAGERGPNRQLLLSIGQDNSQFLAQQAREFPRALKRLGRPEAAAEVFCFYETAQSPTAVRIDGKWAMKGDRTLLVSVPSAKACLPPESEDEHSCALNLTHSEIVKYAQHDHAYGVVRDQLKQIVARAVASVAQQFVIQTQLDKDPHTKAPTLIPMRRNGNFIGRADILERLRQICFPSTAGSNDEDTVALVSLGGLGGIGKTQTALEFSYWVRDNMPGYSIYWISALSMDTFNQSCSEILDKLQLISEGEGNSVDAKKRLKEYLSSAKAGHWLLVLDNADDVRLVKDIRCYLPSSESGFILATTRTEDAALELSLSTKVVNMDVMSSDEGKQLLIKSLRTDRIPDYSHELCDQLLTVLEDLPLAITQAAAYLNRTRTSMQQYIRLLESREDEAERLLSFEVSSAEQWPREKQQKSSYNAVMTTWLVSLDEMKRDEAGTEDNRDSEDGQSPIMELLMFLSRVEPKAIPKTMLPKIRDSTVVLDSTIGTLLNYSFFTKRGGDIYDMHSLVHLAIRSWVAHQKRADDAIDLALDCLERKMRFEDFYSKTSRSTWTGYLPHALRVLAGSNDVQSADRAYLAHYVADCLDADGRYDDALQWALVHAELSAIIFDNDNDEQVFAQCNLAFAYNNADRPADALPVIEAAIAAFQRTRPSDDEWVVEAQVTRVAALRRLGHTRRAVQVLEKLATQLHTRHPEWMRIQNGLAESHLQNGDYDRAIYVSKQALATIEDTLPPEDLRLAAAKRLLARAYLATDKAHEAISLLRDVFDVWEQEYPVSHRNVLISHEDLARAFLVTGDVEQAFAIVERSAQLWAQTVTPENPDSLYSQRWLATVLLAMAKVDRAIDVLEQNLRLRPETTLGELKDITYDVDLLRDVYEAIGDEGNMVRLERKREGIVTLLDEQMQLEQELPETEEEEVRRRIGRGIRRRVRRLISKFISRGARTELDGQ